MKPNEAPNKIWVHELSAKELNVPLKEYHIEYVRSDAFIEKAVEWISEHVEYYMKKDKECNVPLCPLFATKSFIEDFKKYMEGE